MGICIAEEAFSRGASVTLILGPTQLRPSDSRITVKNVISASEMAEETLKHFADADVAILTAAVADFKPLEAKVSKIKRDKDKLNLQLSPTKDIAAALGRVKNENQILIGFALETDNEEKNAKDKLVRKNLDLIVLNSLNDKGAGFGGDTNRVTIIDRSNKIDKFELKSKVEVAKDILDKIENILKK